jgi:S-disulfanyl-L-cysteine oxidoreductase SoxD
VRDITVHVEPSAIQTAMRADTGVTTMDGVYTLAQATRGSNVFAAYCQSCHTPTFHSGPPFRAKWYGRPLGDLFAYLRREMPKNAPGSMSDADYTLAIAYLLRINGMPTGMKPLSSDSAALRRIRLDSVPASPAP